MPGPWSALAGTVFAVFALMAHHALRVERSGVVGLLPIGTATALVLVGGGCVWLGWALSSGMAEAAKQPRGTTSDA